VDEGKMEQRQIIFIPGMNPKPPQAQHRDMLWHTLLEGVRRAKPEAASRISALPECFRLVSWNYLYYRRYRDAGLDLPWIESLLEKPAADRHDIQQAHSWNRRLNRLAYQIGDLFPQLIRWLPKHARATIRATQFYFSNERNIAYHIREQLKRVLRPLLDDRIPVLLIGHSLGSVIAYDTLWELSHIEQHRGKTDFLSIGSPLGMRFVQHRLLGSHYHDAMRYPTNIRRWINLSAVGDITALDRRIHDDFRAMLKLGLIDSIEDHCGGIYNTYRDEDGLNCHRSYGYLVNPAVGKIIADWCDGSAG
jgi:hypothetical protein